MLEPCGQSSNMVLINKSGEREGPKNQQPFKDTCNRWPSLKNDVRPYCWQHACVLIHFINDQQPRFASRLYTQFLNARHHKTLSALKLKVLAQARIYIESISLNALGHWSIRYFKYSHTPHFENLQIDRAMNNQATSIWILAAWRPIDSLLYLYWV